MDSSQSGFMRQRWGLRLLIVLGVLAVVAVVILWFYEPPTSFPPIPQPNGYEALTSAAAKLQRPPDDLKELSTELLAETVAKNQVAVEELRQGLKLPSAVVVQMSEFWFTVHSSELTSLRKAALVLSAEAELKLRYGDTNGSLLTTLEGLRLSEAIQRGGVLIDYMVGSAVEVMAIRRMTNLISGLSAEDCKLAGRALETHQERRDTLEEIQNREKEWSRKAFGTFRYVQAAIVNRLRRSNSAFVSPLPNVVQQYNSATMRIQEALLRLAARAYTLERGTAPQRSSDLVPAYLRSVPADPTTGKPLDLLLLPR